MARVYVSMALSTSSYFLLYKIYFFLLDSANWYFLPYCFNVLSLLFCSANSYIFLHFFIVHYFPTVANEQDVSYIHRKRPRLCM